MKTFVPVMCLLVALASATAHAEKAPDKAICPVCSVHGETKQERVKAEADFEGKTYYFCADDCRAAFEEDPLAYVPPELPRPAPDFVVETLQGEDIAATEFNGKVVLVDFWATWCKPCRKSMPEIQKLYDKYRDRGFTVAGISIDEGEDRAKKVQKFTGKLDVSYPIFLDAKDVPAWFTYKVKAVPAMFLIDREGRIVAEWRGSIDHEAVENEVEKLVETAQSSVKQ
jgi:thiol-disulfide isomerase/thioredoxin